MPKKRHHAAEIIHKLREAGVLLSQGKSVSHACKQLGVSDQSYYRWRKIYGGMKVDQAKRLKELEAENARLKRAVADLTVDELILKEVAVEKYWAQRGGGRR
ncbi:MAG: transposase [Deltaproteobacteria bacterium]|jgi:transposase-like protein|nr:transposase [Deltaproteobacteria bacterium]